MNKKKAKLKYKPNTFEVIEQGDFVTCAVSKAEILIDELCYWNVDLQEAYFSPKEAKFRFEESKRKK
jgi:hypothetical protein|tara:strand:- start:151 stop:351 length:201 start_codon:yes stop_codon:yes gene_type:complete